MVMHSLQMLLMIGSAVAIVAAVALVWAVLLYAIGLDLVQVVRATIQSHRDTRLFKQIEEFRRDFS